MAEKDKVEMEDEIRDKVTTTGKTRIVCRTGSPIDLGDIDIVNLQESKSIIVLSPEGSNPDAQVIKTILAITNNPQRRAEPYHIVAEIRDPKNLDVIKMVGKDEVTTVLVGDLISRINNDTDKLNQFFSQSLVQFVANIITIVGAAIFVLSINLKMGLVAVIPALVLIAFTQVVSPWIKRKNASSLKGVGNMSAEVSESIDNFQVVVAFNRRDYFREKFAEVNEANYKAAVGAGIANNTLTPTYGLASNIAQLAVVAFGLDLIATGHFTIGLLISFLSYVARMYDPMR